MTRIRAAFLRRRNASAGDAGFTLIEAMAAIVVAGLIFSALGGIVVSALRTTLFARQEQQVSDVISQYMEQARNIDYAALGMDATDAATDSAIVGSSYGGEPIVTVTSSPLNPHIVAGGVLRDGTNFTVRRYITKPTDAAGDYKRISIVVSWTKNGITRTKASVTLTTQTRRGLPQPKFTWAFDGSTASAQPGGVSVNRGATVNLGATLTNRGARDRWNITTASIDTSNVNRGWQFAWYNDNGPGTEACDGVRQADENTRMDPNNDGIADTGLIETDRFVCLVGVYVIPVNESLSPAVVNVTLTATSNAVNTISSAVTSKVNLVAQSCPSCTYKFYFLHNPVTVNGTPTSSDMLMNSAAPTMVSLPPYSNDIDSLPGRFVRRGGNPATDTDPHLVANWLWTVPTASVFKAGTAYVDLSAVMNNFNPDGTGALSIQLRYETSTTGVYAQWGAATKTVLDWGYPTFASVVVPVPVSSAGADLSLAANKHIEVRVSVLNTASGDMRIAYDTTTYDSAVALPVVSGG